MEVHPRGCLPLPAAPVAVLRLRGHGLADPHHGRLHLRARPCRRVLSLQQGRAADCLCGEHCLITRLVLKIHFLLMTLTAPATYYCNQEQRWAVYFEPKRSSCSFSVSRPRMRLEVLLEVFEHRFCTAMDASMACTPER